MRPTERKLSELTGQVTCELVRRGSAGEHNAVVMQLAGGGKVVLQRRGGNPFDDPQTRQLAGKKVRVKGFHMGDIFRFIEAEEMEP